MKKTIAEQMAEEQAGVRTERGTFEQIFSLRLIAEQISRYKTMSFI